MIRLGPFTARSGLQSLVRELRSCVHVYMLSCFSHIQLFATLWTVAHQALLSMDSSGRNTGVGFLALLQGIFLTQGSNPCLMSPALAGSLPLRGTCEAHRILQAVKKKKKWTMKFWVCFPEQVISPCLSFSFSLLICSREQISPLYSLPEQKFCWEWGERGECAVTNVIKR